MFFNVVQDIIKIHQRQQTDIAYFPYGVIYISRITTFKEKKSFYLENTIPYYIERWQNYEVDDEIDLRIIENIINLKKEEKDGKFSLEI